MGSPIHPVLAIVVANERLRRSGYLSPAIAELHGIILDLAKQADAARDLLQASDWVLGREWRHTTLNQGSAGDALNAAWDRLVEACEGAPVLQEGGASPATTPGE